MGWNLSIWCSCGAEVRARLSRRFDLYVTKDYLRLREYWLDVEDPPLPVGHLDDATTVPVAGFLAWHDQTRAQLEALGRAAPELYEIVLRDRAGGRAAPAHVPLSCGDRGVRLVAETDDLRAYPTSRDDLERDLRRLVERGLRAIPRVDADDDRQAIERALAGDGLIPPALVDRVVDGSGLILERQTPLEYFADDFAELAQLAAHARACGQPLQANYY